MTPVREIAYNMYIQANIVLLRLFMLKRNAQTHICDDIQRSGILLKIEIVLGKSRIRYVPCWSGSVEIRKSKSKQMHR